MNFKENETATKLRGGYYTAPEIARFLLNWVLVRSPENILEPSCGDGVFFRTLANMDSQSVKSIWGFEIEPQEAAKAQEAAGMLHKIETKIIPKDFLSWSLPKFFTPPLFDAVVGNPPFIRYQYLDKDLQNVTQAIFKYLHLDFTRHTNAWVAFIIASLALLKPGGRLAMVIPSELLHILYAESLRIHLAQTCSKILIFDPQELWFKDTLQGAILILAEKKESRSDKSHGVSVISTRDKEFLSRNPEDYFQQAAYGNGETIQGKWMLGFLSERERSILRDAKENAQICKFDDIAKVAVGIVTGANKYFLVPDAIVEKYELARWAYPMFGRSDHVPGVVYDKAIVEQNRQAGLPTNFIWFQNETFNSLPDSVKSYIQLGENQNLHTRYKCRIRDPWYSVPYIYSTSVGMLKRCHDFPRLIFNKVEAFTTDTAYRIKLKDCDAPSLVYSFVNSLTALTAELEGRHYGGGVLELVPSEIRRLLIPLSKTTEKQVYELDLLVRSNVSAEIILEKQDNILLTKAGLSKQSIEELRQAWLRLKLRRQRQDQEVQSEDDAEMELI
jgi:adenine-specific DNA-methyltransferase